MSEYTRPRSTQRIPIQTGPPGDREQVDPLQQGLRTVADHWGLVMAYGALSIVLGVVVLAWPTSTLTVLAVLLAVQLLVAGVIQLVSAFSHSAATGGLRALLGIMGAVTVLIGLLVLRSPLQTIVVITMLVGAWWLVSGLVDVVAGIAGGPAPGRGWRIGMGAVSAVAGVVVLLQPELSLAVLTIVVGVWMLVHGGLAVAAALQLRALSRQPA
jgi:uncharacterized membrane protein HdeD (DUF308 family)